jgi:hypothetical protein
MPDNDQVATSVVVLGENLFELPSTSVQQGRERAPEKLRTLLRHPVEPQPHE